MTRSHIIDEDETTIINGLDVDHIDDRPDELEHVAIEENTDGDLRALPFNESDSPHPGYVQIDVDLIQYAEVCTYVEENTDYNRRIDFTRMAARGLDDSTAGPAWRI